MFAHIYSFPVISLLLAEEGGALTHVAFADCLPAGCIDRQTPLLAKAAGQLNEYFAGNRRTFDLPLAPRGTPFQQKVWQALRTIPYGQTRSYGDIARQIDAPKACRTVGMANHVNPIAIIIPCHRVIGKSGRLTGYAGGLNIKEYLLRLEQGGLV